MGDRISKTVDNTQSWYVRDASGKILSIYTIGNPTINGGQLTQTEVELNADKRFGISTLKTNVQDQASSTAISIPGIGVGRNIFFTRGEKSYELTNHLGNVLATVSDRKKGITKDNSSINHYEALVTSAQEYYPFGMLMPGRGGNVGDGKNVTGNIIVNGNVIPATLTLTQRTNNQPSEYLATQTISFEADFTSGDSDIFSAYIVDETNADPGSENGVSYGITAPRYRYGFNRKETDNDVKGEGNQQDYGMRVYDPRIGKFLSVDPLRKGYPWNSSYAFAENDVVRSIDLDGLEGLVVIYSETNYKNVEKITISSIIDRKSRRYKIWRLI